MTTEKSPAFQFYPKEFLMDGHVAAMSLQERGAYITLLCLCWHEQELPVEIPKLARMVGVLPEVFAEFWPAVRVCFTEVDGHLIHKRLDKERAKQESYRTLQSTKGKAGAGKRWKPDDSRGHTPVIAQASMNDSRGHNSARKDGRGHDSVKAQAIPNDSSPISDLRTPVVRTDPAIVPYVGKQPAVDDAFEMRAARFCERFGELFLKHRGGARYYQQPNLDWQRACRLLTVWDAARLEKLAVLLLTTDDAWICTTDRTIAILEKKASFLDDLLRQWEQAQEVAP